MDKRRFKRLEIVSDEIVTAYQNGMTLREIGDLHKASPSTVSNPLESRGVTRRRRGPKGGKNVEDN
jgi:hypothetical protein